MYKIFCDSFPILDTSDDNYIVESPKIKLSDNTAGTGSFKIAKNHPCYQKMLMLKSIFEVSDEYGVIFRGRMTEHTRDIYSGKAVDLEGVMTFFNDSIVRPYAFPDDWENENHEDHDAYIAAKKGNMVEFFLGWLIRQHNAQVAEFQQFKLGIVTVKDPNNIITRSETEYPNTWEELRTKLFESSLGGHLCIRYEADGNYIDYLAEFTERNGQYITYGENLRELSQKTDGKETYSAIIPRGTTIASAATTTSKRLTIEDMPDGFITMPDGSISDDIEKKGDVLYSKSAVKAYGWRFVPSSESIWEDVTEAETLQSKAAVFLQGSAIELPNTVEAKAVDLHCADAKIRSFRMYKKIPVYIAPHGINADFDINTLDIDLLSPQNTNIVAGKTVMSMTDLQERQANEARRMLNVVASTAAQTAKDVKETKASVAIVVEGEEVKGDALVEAINNDKTTQKISAARLDIEGKKLNVKVAATNITGKMTAEQINAEGINVPSGTIGAWTLGKRYIDINASTGEDLDALYSAEMRETLNNRNFTYQIFLTEKGVYATGQYDTSNETGVPYYAHKTWLELLEG